MSVRRKLNAPAAGSPLPSPYPYPFPPLVRDDTADGNCLFRCLAHLQYGNEDKFGRVRREICNYETPKNAEASAAHFSKYNDDHPMRKNNVWGTDDEIGRAAGLYGVRIVVFADSHIPVYDSVFNGVPQKKLLKDWYMRISEHHFSILAVKPPIN